jgi:hypothetical protein
MTQPNKIPNGTQPINSRRKGAAGYRPEFAQQAYGMALLGLNIAEMAERFGTDIDTLIVWTKKHPELRKAIWDGGIGADIEVVKALHRLAHGYDVTVKKPILRDGEIVLVEVVEHIPPNTEAARIWVENRFRLETDDSGHGTDPALTPENCASATMQGRR